MSSKIEQDKGEKTGREERVKAALRANLKRRKQKAKALKESGSRASKDDD